ncbi:MAG: ferrochelatase [bacterium]|nr:ferrochelatase [bacterium]
MMDGNEHAGRAPKLDVGVLVANLGTPSAPNPGAVRKYLREFLRDPRIVEAPRLLWWTVLNLAILPFRPRRSAALYQKIWTSEGSPLMVTTERIGRALVLELKGSNQESIPVEVGMRYGSPSLAGGLKRLVATGCNRVLLLPLYPQYSATTTASTFDAVFHELQRYRFVPELRTVNSYGDHPAYIEALSKCLEACWAEEPFPGKLMMSFHGLPQRYVDAGDPYPSQCQHTAQLLAQKLNLIDSAWQVTFQSRFGREPWLEPATDLTLEEFGRERRSGLDVICPGFAVDCLETLEEIAITGREQFESAGGSRFRYIPALGDHPEHIRALSDIASENLRGWV